jgi:hypothetical protein
VSAAGDILEQHELSRCYAALLAIGGRDLDHAAQAEHELTLRRHVPVLGGAGLELCKHDAFEIAESIHEQALLRGGTGTGACQHQLLVGKVGDALGIGIEPHVGQRVRGGSFGATGDGEQESGRAERCAKAERSQIHDAPPGIHRAAGGPYYGLAIEK